MTDRPARDRRTAGAAHGHDRPPVFLSPGRYGFGGAFGPEIFGDLLAARFDKCAPCTSLLLNEFASDPLMTCHLVDLGYQFTTGKLYLWMPYGSNNHEPLKLSAELSTIWRAYDTGDHRSALRFAMEINAESRRIVASEALDLWAGAVRLAVRKHMAATPARRPLRPGLDARHRLTLTHEETTSQ